MPAARIGLKPTLVTRLRGDPGREDDRDRQRQVGEAGLDRAVAEHLLHVERDEEEHREERGADQDPDHVGAGDRAQAEDREGHERRPRAALDRDEGGEQDHRGGERCRSSGPSPSRRRSASSRAKTRAERPSGDRRPRRRRRSGGPRPRRGVSAIRLGAIAAAAIPIGTLTQSTHSQPRPSVRTPPSRTPAAPPEPATAPQTPSALLRSAPSRKVVVTIESAAGERIAAPRPCTARAAISWPGVGREPARQRGEREEDQAEHEDAPAPEQVGQPPAQQQEAAEGEDVGVDDPGQVALGEVERFADRRQRHVDDRGVEDDDELRRRRAGPARSSACRGPRRRRSSGDLHLG